MDVSLKKDWLERDGFPLSILRFNPQPPLDPHIHDFSELVIITGGHGKHVSGRASWPLSTGDVFVISGARPHNYVEMNGLCLTNILFDPPALSLDRWDLMSLPGYHAMFTLEPNWHQTDQFRSRLRISGRNLSVVLAMIDQLDHELRRRGVGFQTLAAALFSQLIVFLSRHYQEAARPDTQALLRLGDAIAHLEQVQHESVDLDDLARIAHMSKRNFLRVFSKALGTSPIQYSLQLRIARAAADLRRGQMDITRIAHAYGFNDSNYFSRKFRQIMGLSPRDYRRRFQPVERQ